MSTTNLNLRQRRRFRLQDQAARRLLAAASAESRAAMPVRNCEFRWTVYTSNCNRIECYAQKAKSRHLMRHVCILVALTVAGISGCASAPVSSGHLASLLAEARAELGGAPHVPVYLPSRLPAAVTSIGVVYAVGQHRRRGYNVSLYYSAQPSNATFAVSVSGSTRTFQHLPNTQAVHLGNGAPALFRPVSCGGSCAGANLWWRINGNEYNVQLSLPSRLPSKRQLSALLVVANSMVRYP